MNKKTVITYALIAVLLVGGIAALVASLYGDRKVKPAAGRALLERFDLLRAVPSDAAALMCFEDFSHGVDILTDDTKCFEALVCDGPASPFGCWLASADTLLASGAKALKSAPMAISLHHSGTLMPLMMVEASDSAAVASLLDGASACGLFCEYFDTEDIPVLLVSPSETLIHSSERHLAGGVSILSGSDFSDCAAQTTGRNIIFFSHTYSSRLMQGYFRRAVSRNSSFIKTFASWTALSIDSIRDDQLQMSGLAFTRGSDLYYAQTLASGFGGTASFQNVVPSNTVYAVALQTADLEGSLGSYRSYLDASSRLQTNNTTRQNLAKQAGKTPDQWAKDLQIKEVVKVRWHAAASADPLDAVMLRMGRKDRSATLDVQDFSYSGFASSLFGSLFSLEDESSYTSTGEWLVIGSYSAVSDFASRYSEGDNLRSLLSDTSCGSILPGRECSMVSYFSPGECKLEETFSAAFKRAIDVTFNGAAYEPTVLWMDSAGLHMDVRRVAVVTKTNTPALVVDAAVDVPSGPFEVFNSGTGETCLLQQQPNMYLSFKKMDGSGIWSVPFSGPLCGAVESIDYYNNGRSQFLFASGSSLWLLDRLGRFVNDFPADLGKEVLLGPAAYDFTGAKGYTAMVLHTDNTIGMYNLHGVPPVNWLGITSEDTILSLPELFELDGNRYWIVRTAREALVFPFDGGAHLRDDQGGKTIRRDSTFEINENGSVKVTCNDGKVRNIKF